MLIFLTTGFIHTPLHTTFSFFPWQRESQLPLFRIYLLVWPKSTWALVWTTNLPTRTLCFWGFGFHFSHIVSGQRMVSHGFVAHSSCPFLWCHVVRSSHRIHGAPFAFHPRILQLAGWFLLSLHTVKFPLGGVVLWVLTNACSYAPTPTAPQRSSVALKIPSCDPFEVKYSPSPKH